MKKSVKRKSAMTRQSKLQKPSHKRVKKTAARKPRAGCLTASHLIKDFLRLQEKLGRRPKIVEYKRECHTMKVIDRVFGKPGWRRFLKAIGEKALPGGPMTREHLLQDYLETGVVLGREPSFEEFRLRHRHVMKTIYRLFGTPGWAKLKKAAAKVVFTPEKRPASRPEHEIMTDIRETYRALLPGRLIPGDPATRRESRTPGWKLRNRLNDLFYELGRVVAVADAFPER